MSPNNFYTWVWIFVGAGGAFVGVAVAKKSALLLRGKSIKEVVDSANAIIAMYEKHVGALELKVGDLEKEIGSLKNKLDETLKHNVALQKLLLASPAVVLPTGEGTS